MDSLSGPVDTGYIIRCDGEILAADVVLCKVKEAKQVEGIELVWKVRGELKRNNCIVKINFESKKLVTPYLKTTAPPWHLKSVISRMS